MEKSVVRPGGSWDALDVWEVAGVICGSWLCSLLVTMRICGERGGQRSGMCMSMGARQRAGENVDLCRLVSGAENDVKV